VSSTVRKLRPDGRTGQFGSTFGQALETKLIEKGINNYATIMDPFLIALDVPCDIRKQPIVTLFRANERFGQWLLHQFGCAAGKQLLDWKT
jgi:hypothetical protein